MTQSQLNHAVARATGESLQTIQRLGFSFVPPPRLSFRRPRRRRHRTGSLAAGIKAILAVA